MQYSRCRFGSSSSGSGSGGSSSGSSSRRHLYNPVSLLALPMSRHLLKPKVEASFMGMEKVTALLVQL